MLAMQALQDRRTLEYPVSMDSRNLSRFERRRMSDLSPPSRLKLGMISFGRAKMECTVRAMSAFGATLTVPSLAGIPDEFVLTLGSSQKTYTCNVVKRRGVSIGVVFVPGKSRRA